MKATAIRLGLDAPKSQPLLDRRYAERASVCSRVTYLDEDNFEPRVVEGRLRDLSRTGCQIESLNAPIPGSRLTLTIDLSDGQPPLCLSGVTVCRVNGNLWGAKFPSLNSDERRRVQEMILKRVSLSSSAHQRAAFRIV